MVRKKKKFVLKKVLLSGKSVTFFYSHLIKVFLLNLVFSLNKCHLAESFFPLFSHKLQKRNFVRSSPPPAQWSAHLAEHSSPPSPRGPGDPCRNVGSPPKQISSDSYPDPWIRIQDIYNAETCHG